jgi:ribosomal subunit interface protein
MQLPLQVILRDIAQSDAVERYIRERAAKLDGFYDRITACRVVVEAPVRHHRKGGPFKVRIDLSVPGAELVVNRQARDDLYVAIRDAFDAVRRRLEDHARRQRGAVKLHGAVAEARVGKLFPDEGYGFLETRDGREVYFHRNSVVGSGFGGLTIGAEVRYVEEQGDEGPQASTVTLMRTARRSGG